MKIEIDYVDQIELDDIKEVKTRNGTKFYTRHIIIKHEKTSDLIIVKARNKETLEMITKKNKKNMN